EPSRAAIAVAPGRALQLRSRALETGPAPASLRLPADWDVIRVAYTDRFAFAGALAALGDAVVVLEPHVLHADVVAHLRAVAALAAAAEEE
ncbi:WYL domain-containing protein, partial [Actinomyces sp. MRS3W]|nr:WYL domain-containing protein [Actinomyces sp. MRS3W]